MKYTIGQVLERIESGDRMVNIVGEFGLNKKIFSRQLNEQGFRGDKAGRYHWDHDTPPPLDYDLLEAHQDKITIIELEPLGDAVDVPTVIEAAPVTNADIPAAAPEIKEPNKVTNADNKDKIETNKDKPKKAASKSIAKVKPAAIQLVADKEKKVYRGYYFDSDVIKVMNKIDNKSEVVNEALTEYLKNHGLL